MAEDFEIYEIAAPAQPIFESVRTKLMFESDILWARASTATNCSKSGWTPIRPPETFENAILWQWSYRDSNRRPWLVAQQCVANLRKILLQPRKVHSRADYARMAEPILLEIQQRDQQIFEYVSRDLELSLAS